MKTVYALGLLLSLLLSSQCYAQWSGASGEQGFLCNPPVFVPNEPDFPLTGLGVIMPQPGQLLPDVDLGSLESDGWNVDGDNVQPELNVEIDWLRVGALRGFNGGWAAGISIPWYRTKVRGSIGGEPASGVADGIGNIALGAKKVLWEDCTTGRRLILGAGVELPTGSDDERFGQDNVVTNGYYQNDAMRMPLGWQPSTGTWNGLFALSYGQTRGRMAWQALLAAKVFGKSDEDVKIGNFLIGAVTGTYGITRDFAGSLGLTVRAQEDDDYPNSPLPVNGPLLAGTTSHSTTLYLDASLRYTIARAVTVGVGIRTPIAHPDEGMDPDTQFSVIFYPNAD